MPRSITRVKPIRQILTAADRDVMVQLVRLIILYEDLKLEVAGLHIPPDKEFDEVSKRYRQLYFVRRAFATLDEMHSAFQKLNMLRTFKDRRRNFDRRQLKTWTAAIRFFARAHAFIDSQRNAFGGHVHDDLAHYILDRVEPDDDSPGAFEVKISDDHTQHYVFKFAEDMITMALFVDRGERDRAEFLRESFETLMDAVRHSAHATQMLADSYILPTFGWHR
jgi:hypothetical protein